MEKVLTVKEWIQKKKLDEIAEYIRTSPEIKASYDSLARTARGYGISSRMKGEAVVDSVAGEIKVKVNNKLYTRLLYHIHIDKTRIYTN